jgi:protein-disulfide isomerase
MSLSRRSILAASAGMAVLGSIGLSGCEKKAFTPTDGDMAMGAETAKVTLIEYFSATCGHCAHFHMNVYPQIKENYVDTGRIRYVFRELLTPPAAVSLAGFQVARCGGATTEQYMSRLGVMFENQSSILSGSPAAIRERLIEIGRAAGLSEDQVTACISDETGPTRTRAFEEQAAKDGATGTPTFLINGTVWVPPPGTPNVTYEQLSAALDAALTAAG